MKMMKWKMSQSIKMRMFVLLSSIFMMAFLAYHGILLVLFRTTYTDFMMESNNRILERTTTYYDSVVSSFQSTAQMISEDGSVLTTAGVPTIGNYVRNTAVINLLEAAVNNSSFIDNAYLFIRRKEFLISSNGQVAALPLSIDQDISSFLSGEISSEGIYIDKDAEGKQNLYYVYPFPSNRRFFLGSIVFRLNEDELSNLLDDRYQSSKTGFYILNDSDKLCISPDGLSEDVIWTGDGNEGLPEDGEYVFRRGRYYFLRDSGVSNIRYVYVTGPIQIFMADKQMIVVLILAFLILVAILLVFAGWAAKILYSPLSRTVALLMQSHEKNMDTDLAGNSGNEYQIMENQVEKLISENIEKDSTIRQATPFMVESLILNLLRGNNLDQEMTFYRKFVDIPVLDKMRYVITILSLDKYEDEDDCQYRMNLLRQIVDGQEHILNWYCFCFKSNSLVILWLEEKSMEPAKLLDVVRGKVSDILQKALQGTDLIFTTGISDTHCGLNHIWQAYAEASTALMYRLYSKNGSVILYEEIKDHSSRGSDTALPHYEKEENKIINAISTGNVATLDVNLQTFFDNLRKHAGTDKNYIISVLIMLLKQISGHFAAADAEIVSQAGNLKEQFSMFEKMDKADEMFKYTADICHVLQQQIMVPDLSNQKRYIQRAAEYVSLHYMENDFSLTRVSDSIGISKSYLSTLFKQEYHQSFVDYVNLLRVKRAKELLEDGNVSVQEVGRLVGCGSTQNFIRIFIKYEGITPKQYRNRLKE